MGRLKKVLSPCEKKEIPKVSRKVKTGKAYFKRVEDRPKA